MTDFSHALIQTKLIEDEFFLEVDVTENLYSAMSKISKNLQDPETNESPDSTRLTAAKPLATITESNKNIHEKFCEDLIEWEPFVELGAVCKLLNVLKPECLKFTESTESCFREIIDRLEKLLEDWITDDKRIKKLLSKDNSLMKCEQCGVISIKRRKNNHLLWKPFDRNTQNFKTQRFLKEQPNITGYSKVYDERKTFLQKDEKNNFVSTRSGKTAENCKNVQIRDDERYQQFFKADDSTVNEISLGCRSMVAGKEIDSILVNQKSDDKKCDDKKINKQKTFTKKFDKYSDRPLIEVSAPIRKPSHIPKSNARLTQYALSQRMKRRNLEVKPKDTTIDAKKSNETFTRAEEIKNIKECKNTKETNIEKQSEEVKLEEDFNPNQTNVSNLEIHENHLKLKFRDKSNTFPEINKPSQKKLHNGEDQFEQHLAKGDCSSIQINKDLFSKVESLSQRICELNHDSLGFDHWVFKEEKYLKKKNLEAIKQEISLSNLITIYSARNILESEQKENDTRTYRSTSEENLIHESMTSPKKSKIVLKETKSLKKTQSAGIQTDGFASLETFQKIRAQITEAIDRFENYKMAECEPKFDEHQDNKLQMNYINPSPISSSSWAITELGSVHSDHFQKQIDYKNLMSKEKSSKIFSIYTKVLEGNEEMDWETFEELVETLHPTQRQLWRDICTAVKNEAKRVAGKNGETAEVCIEIKSVPKKKKRKEKRVIESGDEIAFEMEMTLNDMENFLEEQLRSCLFEKKKKKKVELV